MSDTDTLHIIKQFITDYTTKARYNINTPLYKGNLPIGNNTYSIVGVFFENSPHALADSIIESTDTDIVLLLNLQQKVVLLRKSKTCDIDLGKLAKQLSTGGGKPDVAGCLLNDKIINLTKLLQPC
jgi:hypothetical protein